MPDISKPHIDITTTATVRPSILSQTLTSVVRHICKNEIARYRLVINIDNIGEKVGPKRVVKTARKHFKNVVYNISNEPSFTKAVKWVWANATAPYIFHIEDDWLINRDINVDDMIRILSSHKKLSSLRLSKFKIPKKDSVNIFGCYWLYQKDGFYLANNWKNQFGLNPILIKKQFIDEALPVMVDDINPEKQFRASRPHMSPIIKRWQYGMYEKPGSKPSVRDIGRNWIKRTKFSKTKAATFITWRKR